MKYSSLLNEGFDAIMIGRGSKSLGENPLQTSFKDQGRVPGVTDHTEYLITNMIGHSWKHDAYPYYL